MGEGDDKDRSIASIGLAQKMFLDCISSIVTKRVFFVTD